MNIKEQIEQIKKTNDNKYQDNYERLIKRFEQMAIEEAKKEIYSFWFHYTFINSEGINTVEEKWEEYLRNNVSRFEGWFDHFNHSMSYFVDFN